MAYCCETSEDTGYTSFDVLAAEVGISLPAVADAIVKAALVRATMKVVDKAKLIKHTITQDFFSGVRDYPLELPGCLTILQVESVKFMGDEVPFEVVDDNWVRIDFNTCGGEDTRKGLDVVAYTGISRDACELPNTIYERYGEVIINRTLSTLYGMHGQAWYDANLVRFYGGIAEGGITQAKQDRLEQDTVGGIPIDTGALII